MSETYYPAHASRPVDALDVSIRIDAICTRAAREKASDFSRGPQTETERIEAENRVVLVPGYATLSALGDFPRTRGR